MNNNSNKKNNSFSQNPVFIHSLFRSGSTYFFNVFRRSNAGYWCYQEPLHEVIYITKNNQDTLLKMHSEVAEQLRHPFLDKPYYQELCEIRDNWKDTLKKHSIYDQYFVTTKEDESIPYFDALIKGAKGIPVIQECRTSSRIGNIKNVLNGIHIYLWRNPWDQWWSYQINDYFNAITMLILNAKHHPKEIAIFREKIQFMPFDCADIFDQVMHFKSIPTNAAVSYQAFYLLWCLGLREAWKHADIMVNIDKLSYDMEYRAAILKKFDSLSLYECDFSDSTIPQAFYAQKDKDFFNEQEEEIHKILLLADWPEEDLTSLQLLRKQFTPEKQQWSPQTAVETMLLKDVENLRLWARSAMNNESIILNENKEKITYIEDQLNRTIKRHLFKFFKACKNHCRNFVNSILPKAT